METGRAAGAAGAGGRRAVMGWSLEIWGNGRGPLPGVARRAVRGSISESDSGFGGAGGGVGAGSGAALL